MKLAPLQSNDSRSNMSSTKCCLKLIPGDGCDVGISDLDAGGYHVRWIKPRGWPDLSRIRGGDEMNAKNGEEHGRKSKIQTHTTHTHTGCPHWPDSPTQQNPQGKDQR